MVGHANSTWFSLPNAAGALALLAFFKFAVACDVLMLLWLLLMALLPSQVAVDALGALALGSPGLLRQLQHDEQQRRRQQQQQRLRQRTRCPNDDCSGAGCWPCAHA